MHILMFGWEFPPYINGGLGIACYEIIQALLNRHLSIQLILPTPKSETSSDLSSYEQPTKLMQNSFSMHFVDSILVPYLDAANYAKLNQDGYGRDLITEVKRFAVLAANYASIMPHDIIYAHDWLTILAGILAKEKSKKPLFFHVHSLETDRSQHPNLQIQKIELEGLHAADKIFAVSGYTRDILIKKYQIPARKISVIYNGIPSAFDRHKLDVPKIKDKIVLFLGRITYQKGPFYFLEAARKILSIRQDIKFVIAGDGDLRDSLVLEVARLKLSSHIQFVGFLNRARVREMYEISQVYVMPSVSEPFGLTCLEALILNVPVVLSKQSGVAEVLPDLFKVNYWDTDTMAQNIMTLIDSPLVAKKMLGASNASLTKLTWDNAAEQIIANFKEA